MSILLFLAAPSNLLYMQHSHATAIWLHHRRFFHTHTHSHTLFTRFICLTRNTPEGWWCSVHVCVCVLACALVFAFRSLSISPCMCMYAYASYRECVCVCMCICYMYGRICFISVYISVFFPLSKYTWHENSNRSRNQNKKTNKKISFHVLQTVTWNAKLH